MNFSKDSGNKGGKGSLVNGAAKIGKLFYPASFFKFFFHLLLSLQRFKTPIRL